MVCHEYRGLADAGQPGRPDIARTLRGPREPGAVVTLGPVRRTAAVLVVALALALALTACGSGEVEVRLDGEPAAAIARAVDRGEGTVRYRVHVTLATELYTATQSTAGISESDGDSHATTTTTFAYAEGYEDLGGGAGLDRLSGTVERIEAGGTVYTRAADGDAPAGRPELPDGIEWLAEDGGSSSLPGAAAGVGPRTILRQLADASEVEDQGTAEVDGEPIRWLKAAAPGTSGDAAPVPAGTTVDVALDVDGLVRRIAFTVEAPDGTRTRVIVDYYEYGVDGTVEPPPADATIDRGQLERS